MAYIELSTLQKSGFFRNVEILNVTFALPPFANYDCKKLLDDNDITKNMYHFVNGEDAIPSSLFFQDVLQEIKPKMTWVEKFSFDYFKTRSFKCLNGILCWYYNKSSTDPLLERITGDNFKLLFQNIYSCMVQKKNQFVG